MRYLFLTGKLAEPALRRVLGEIAPKAGFEYDVAALNISVAALMTPAWVARHLPDPSGFDRIMLTGYCEGDLQPIEAQAGVSVERGPRDLRDLPEHFGQKGPSDYGGHDIEILAEVNHAPRRSRAEILAEARHYRDSGANLIDLGCDPGEGWSGVGDAVKTLRDEGMRVSIDSMNPVEAKAAVDAGAELILSVNRGNLDFAKDWGCEVVAVPDVPATLEGLDQVVEALAKWSVPFRIDPILEPIGFGFAASLARYGEVRRRYPDAELMMGVGNLTELTDADSAGINVLLLGFCQELGIRSVLTTEVINWARSSVKELDLSRRLVYYAVKRRVPPKRLEPNLVMLRDPKLREHGEDALKSMAERVTDKNFRLFAEGGLLHAINGQMHLSGRDPFELFEQIRRRADIDSSHAFYLGYELAKAVTALTLGKNYVQDEALNWGLLTEAERSHRNKIADSMNEGGT